MGLDTLYRENIIDHYKSPRNAGVLENYSHTSEQLNRSCGDEITVYLDIKDGIVVDIGYKVSGCAICTASISMLSEQIKGNKLEDVLKISDLEVLSSVGLSEVSGRIKCGLLSIQTVRAAIDV